MDTSNKERKPSYSYTMRQFGTMVAKLADAQLLTEDETEELKKLHQKIVNRWISKDLGLNGEAE